MAPDTRHGERPASDPASASDAVLGGAAVRAAARLEIVEPAGNASVHGRMPIRGVFLAALAALCGALIWVLVGLALGRDVGPLAWPVGLAVGVAASLGGGRGARAGAVCATLALVSVLGGRLVLDGAWAERAALEEADTMRDLLAYYREDYDEAMDDAEAFVGIARSDAAVRRFMIDRGFTGSGYAADIDEEELSGFREHVASGLSDLAERRPTFEGWVRANGDAALLDAVSDDTPIGAASRHGSAAGKVPVTNRLGAVPSIVDGLGPVDWLFALLGVGTAFVRGRTPLGKDDRRASAEAGSGPGGAGSRAREPAPPPADVAERADRWS